MVAGEQQLELAVLADADVASVILGIREAGVACPVQQLDDRRDRNLPVLSDSAFTGRDQHDLGGPIGVNTADRADGRTCMR